MSRLKPVLVVGALSVALAGAWVCLGLRYASDYRRFRAQDNGYYSQVAEACEAILRQHPAPFVGLSPDPDPARPGYFRVPADDALPRILGALAPDVLSISTNSAYVGFGGVARLHWGIVWLQDEDSSNCWTLISVGPAERVLYVKYQK